MNRAPALLLLLLACGTAAPAPTPTVKDAIDGYMKLSRMTEKPYQAANGLGSPQCWRIPGRGPHSSTGTHIFMDDLAAANFHKPTTYPVGSVIVKEKVGTSSGEKERKQPHLAGMIKRKSSSPPTVDDWEFFYVDEERNLSAAKVLQSCKDCHANASKKDFVFGDWAKMNQPAVNKP